MNVNAQLSMLQTGNCIAKTKRNNWFELCDSINVYVFYVALPNPRASFMNNICYYIHLYIYSSCWLEFDAHPSLTCCISQYVGVREVVSKPGTGKSNRPSF